MSDLGSDSEWAPGLGSDSGDERPDRDRVTARHGRSVSIGIGVLPRDLATQTLFQDSDDDDTYSGEIFRQPVARRDVFLSTLKGRAQGLNNGPFTSVGVKSSASLDMLRQLANLADGVTDTHGDAMEKMGVLPHVGGDVSAEEPEAVAPRSDDAELPGPLDDELPPEPLRIQSEDSHDDGMQTQEEEPVSEEPAVPDALDDEDVPRTDLKPKPQEVEPAPVEHEKRLEFEASDDSNDNCSIVRIPDSSDDESSDDAVAIIDFPVRLEDRARSKPSEKRSSTGAIASASPRAQDRKTVSIAPSESETETSGGGRSLSMTAEMETTTGKTAEDGTAKTEEDVAPSLAAGRSISAGQEESSSQALADADVTSRSSMEGSGALPHSRTTRFGLGKMSLRRKESDSRRPAAAGKTTSSELGDAATLKSSKSAPESASKAKDDETALSRLTSTDRSTSLASSTSSQPSALDRVDSNTRTSLFSKLTSRSKSRGSTTPGSVPSPMTGSLVSTQENPSNKSRSLKGAVASLTPSWSTGGVGTNTTSNGPGLPYSDFSFLECVVDLLKGACILRRRKIIKVKEVWAWVPEDMSALHWRVGSAKSAAEVSGTGSRSGVVQLKTVRRIKGYGEIIFIEYGDVADHFELMFPTREQSSRWISGLSCLVPGTAQIKSNNARKVDLSNYNLFMDTWNGKPLLERKRVAEYILLGTIGRGSFGKVKLGISVKDKHFCAIKVVSKAVLRRQQRSGTFCVPADKGFGIGSNREIAIMKKLEHPNIIGLNAVFDDEEGDNLYMVLEYMSGGYVMNSSKLTGADPLSEDRCREIFIQALSGLEYLHRNRIVHRDLKPENLLTKSDGTVKISDFGAAKYYELEAGDRGCPEGAPLFANPVMKDSGRTTVGTPAFTAPELCLSDKAPCQESPEYYAADIWSLGASIYYMAYGQGPFLAESVFQMYDAICTQEVSFPEQPRLSDEFKELIRGLLIKDPEKRTTISGIWKTAWVEEGAQEGLVRQTSHGWGDTIKITDEDMHNAVLSVKTLLHLNHRPSLVSRITSNG